MRLAGELLEAIEGIWLTMKLIDAVIWITVSVLNVWWKVTGKPYIHTITYAIETTEERADGDNEKLERI